ncbi:sensor histidine kinase [Candidatus Methanoperedens nitratireducens]|uniref:histidine kinase n=1 Tax=Candidatus Methanoperedens nitratireducens TaxID=1392998 RepID=A0A284VLC7_9EURY|nr:sensor histidine kinase [Candidatus Methanoperedens nitroreducens]SNQ60064.1 putative Two-component sensor kinase [Candidatus Methanoperedens nitroreducens]
MNIRSEQILFFLIISVIPLSIVVYISYDYSKDAIRDSVMANLLGATENTGNAIDNWMDAREDDIRVISRSGIIAFKNKERSREYLNTFEREHQGVYSEFFILDAEGNIIFSTLNNTGNAGKEHYFIEAARGKLYISDISISEINGSPEIIIANPVIKNGTIAGILAARVSLENLYRIIEKIDIGRSGEVFIVNKDGNIIFHKNRSKILLDSINNNFAVREVTYEKNGINEYTNYKGEKVLGSYYWLPLYRWGIIVEENIDEAYEGALTLGQLIVSISSLAIIVVISLVMVISRRLTDPIKSLEEGATGLVKGDFKPIKVSSSNEIGRLTEIFNRTSAELLDIRKKLEDKIEIANKDLEEKNKKLISANEELKQLDKLKSDFISLVSHELKTPLSSIRLSAECLESEENMDPAVKKQLLKTMIRNIDRQTRFINEILDLSKIEAGKMEFRLEHADFGEIANMAYENIRQLALKKNITVSLDIPEKLPSVLADREKLIIVLNNLFENALKFTPDGGSILLSAKDEVDGIEVKMKDTGVGIEKEKLGKIFEKFYQVDSASRRKIGGCGLGLSISSGIIRAHGSEIHVESEPGKGSAFSFRLKKVGL